VDEVVPHSPSARLVSKLDQYDKITAINGQKVESPEKFYSLILGQFQQEIKLDLLSRNGINRSVYLTPVSTEEFRDLTYNYRVEMARAQVDKLSDGKIAYFHLSQITPKSLDHFEAELLKYSKGRDGMILDLRGNIGGTEHDRLIQILSRRKYISHRPRHGKPGFDADVVVPPNLTVLIDERTSSDAEIVAQGIRELGLGEIVGVRSYGAVIGTEQKTLLNGATLSIPSVGWFSMSGDNLENNGVQPDFVIPLDLTAADKGEDNQLKEATERLLQRM
jgi:C-terminal processing protease CtpA/Prc